jgi:hypothetical protein
VCHSISFIHFVMPEAYRSHTTFKAAWWCIWHMKSFVGCCAPIKIVFAAIIIGYGWGVLVDNWLGWLGWLGAPLCRRSLGGRHDGLFHVVATRTYEKFFYTALLLTTDYWRISVLSYTHNILRNFTSHHLTKSTKLVRVGCPRNDEHCVGDGAWRSVSVFT